MPNLLAVAEARPLVLLSLVMAIIPLAVVVLATIFAAAAAGCSRRSAPSDGAVDVPARPAGPWPVGRRQGSVR